LNVAETEINADKIITYSIKNETVTKRFGNSQGYWKGRWHCICWLRHQL